MRVIWHYTTQPFHHILYRYRVATQVCSHTYEMRTQSLIFLTVTSLAPSPAFADDGICSLNPYEASTWSNSGSGDWLESWFKDHNYDERWYSWILVSICMGMLKLVIRFRLGRSSSKVTCSFVNHIFNLYIIILLLITFNIVYLYYQGYRYIVDTV
jgi:hypothetical protein